jgi:hypothetical protein
VEWDLHNGKNMPKIKARRDPSNPNIFYGERQPQKNPAVDAFEKKINPNDESVYVLNEDGSFVQFEGLDEGALVDGKCAIQQESFFLKLKQAWAKEAREKFVRKAERQVETAEKQGLRVEFHVTREDVAVALRDLFKDLEKTRKIIVRTR